MYILSLLFYVSLTFIIALIFVYGLRMRGPWGSFWIFFLIILLAMLAADLWIQPVGPFFRDIYWLPPLAVGIMIALLLAATTPRPWEKTRLEQERAEEAQERSTSLALGAFFWVLLIFMLVIVIAGFLNNIYY
jgi:hypothetical protein